MNTLFFQFMYSCWIIFLFYTLATAFSVKKTAETPEARGKINWFSWGYRILAIIIIIAAVAMFKNGLAGPILWHRTLTVGIIADIVTLAGLLLALWARTTLGKNWSGNVVIKEDHELIKSGPYAYVRHPIYSNILLFVLGIAIYHGHVGSFVLFVMFIAGAWYKAHREEVLLTEHFGQTYLDYKKKVKGLVPWVF